MGISKDDNGDREGESIPNFPSPAMNTAPPQFSENLLPILRTSTGTDPFYCSPWNPPLNPSSYSLNFVPSVISKSSTPLTLEDHYICLPEMVPPELPCFDSGSFSEFCNLQRFPIYHEDTSNNNSPKSEELCRTSEKRLQLVGKSINAKRRRKEVDSSSSLNPQMRNDPSSELQELALSDKKKGAEHESLKDVCVNEDGPVKHDYVHVRARRGQATNSHSLAERVRREKISERMKMLEELVPGCNKITGKAVMLDEIINYVQSLQRQVEFLSMKLASVNPELNVNIGRFVSKDTSVDGFSDGMKCCNLFPPPLAVSQLCSIPPEGVLWDNGIHNVFQMGYESSNFGTTIGGPKSEL